MEIDQAFVDKLMGIYHRQYNGWRLPWPWYVYAAVVLQLYDESALISQLWRTIVEMTDSENDQLHMVLQIREALLKASVLVGFPKGINALSTLRAAIARYSPDLQQSIDAETSLRQTLSQAEKGARGKAFFSKLYAQHTDRVLENMSKASGGDLAEFAINSVYGDLMAETSYLDERLTSLLEFIACYGSGGSAALQAKSHMYGCHNLGNDKAEILSAIAICHAIEGGLGVIKDRSDWTWLSKIESWESKTVRSDRLE